VFAAIRNAASKRAGCPSAISSKDKTMKDWIVPPVVIPIALALAILAIVLMRAFE